MKRLSIILIVLPALLAGCIKDDAPAAFIPGGSVAVEVPVAPLTGQSSLTRALGPIEGWNTYPTNEVYMAYADGPKGAGPRGTFETDPVYTKCLKGIVAGDITVFQPLLFYPEELLDHYNIYLKGFYPREGVRDFNEVTNPAMRLTDSKVTYTIAGNQDVMMSSMVCGSLDYTLKDQYEDPDDENVRRGATLRYQHLLSRLSVKVRCDAAWPSTIKLQALRVLDVSDTAILDFRKDYTDPDALVFQAPRDKVFTVYENSDGLPLTTTAFGSQPALGNVMIEPLSGFRLEVELSTGDVITVPKISFLSAGVETIINQTGTDTATTIYDIIRRGYHYQVELTFQSVGVNADAINTNFSLQPWTPMDAGNEEGWW